MDTLEKELTFKQLQSYITVLSTIDDFIANIDQTCKVLGRQAFLEFLIN